MLSNVFSDKIKVRVYFEDTDAGGVVYHSRYLNFAERARAEFLRKLKLNQTDIKMTYGIVFVVKSLEVNYISFSRLDDKIEIITELKEINRVKLVFNHRFLTEKTKIAQISVNICCINVAGKVARIPKSLYDKLILKG